MIFKYVYEPVLIQRILIGFKCSLKCVLVELDLLGQANFNDRVAALLIMSNFEPRSKIKCTLLLYYNKRQGKPY